MVDLSFLLLVCFDFSSFGLRSSFFFSFFLYLFLSFSLPVFPVVLFLLYYRGDRLAICYWTILLKYITTTTLITTATTITTTTTTTTTACPSRFGEVLISVNGSGDRVATKLLICLYLTRPRKRFSACSCSTKKQLKRQNKPSGHLLHLHMYFLTKTRINLSIKASNM